MAGKTREAMQRENEVVHAISDKPWVRGASLIMPPAKPGHDQRWVRFAMGDKPDPTNYARKIREGWTPRDADSLPEEWQSMKMDQGRHAGCIVVEGSILCERPVALSKRRNEHFQKETERRTEALYHDLDTVNRENKSVAYGPIRKAIDSRPAREVPIQGDE